MGSAAITTISPGQQEQLDRATGGIAQQLASGLKPQSIVKSLVRNGMSERDALALVEQIRSTIDAYRKSPEGQRILAAKHLRDLWTGMVWCIGGTLVSMITYSLSNGRGMYFIFWGAVVVGAAQAALGLVGWLKHR